MSSERNSRVAMFTSFSMSLGVSAGLSGQVGADPGFEVAETDNSRELAMNKAARRRVVGSGRSRRRCRSSSRSGSILVVVVAVAVVVAVVVVVAGVAVAAAAVVMVVVVAIVKEFSSLLPFDFLLGSSLYPAGGRYR